MYTPSHIPFSRIRPTTVVRCVCDAALSVFSLFSISMLRINIWNLDSEYIDGQKLGNNATFTIQLNSTLEHREKTNCLISQVDESNRKRLGENLKFHNFPLWLKCNKSSAQNGANKSVVIVEITITVQSIRFQVWVCIFESFSEFFYVRLSVRVCLNGKPFNHKIYTHANQKYRC